MKKSLIALAVAAALPATAMAGSQVRLYGIADAYIGFDDDDRAAASRSAADIAANAPSDGGVRVGSGGQSTARWGMDGSEDLGGGMAAVFKYEASIGTDTGTSNAFTRRSYVGLKGGFGEVVMGRTYSPIFWTLLENDVGGMAHTINGWPGATDGNGNQLGRWNNGIYYDGKFGPIKLYAAYGAGEAGNGTGDDALGVGARMNFGPIGMSLAYQDNFGDKYKQIGFNGAFGPIKLGLNLTDADSFVDKRIGVSASVKVGASGSILLNAVKQNATNVQLFYRQGLSKRTNWYAGLLSFGSGGGKSFQVGVRHRF